MLNENAKKWIAELRSGNFKQTRLALSDGNGHCCLGVACETALRNGVKMTVTPATACTPTRYDGKTAVLPETVREWLGLNSVRGDFIREVGPDGFIYLSSLPYLNDRQGHTFEQIADLIESEPKGLFHDASN